MVDVVVVVDVIFVVVFVLEVVDDVVELISVVTIELVVHTFSASSLLFFIAAESIFEWVTSIISMMTIDESINVAPTERGLRLFSPWFLLKFFISKSFLSELIINQFNTLYDSVLQNLEVNRGYYINKL